MPRPALRDRRRADLPEGTRAGLPARARAALGRPRFIALFGAIFAASQLTILAIIEPLGASAVLRLQTALTPDTFVAIEQEWIAAGVLDSYWRHFVPDFAHPSWYGLFLASCMAGALDFARSPSSLDPLVMLPFLGAGCDLIENSLHVLFLLEPGAIAQPWVAISGTFTHLKWLLLLTSLLIAVSLTGWELTRRALTRR